MTGKKCLLSELAEIENATKPVMTGQDNEIDETETVTYTCSYRETMRFSGSQWQGSGNLKQFQVTCGPGGEWKYPVSRCQGMCRLNQTLLPQGIRHDRDPSVNRVREGEAVT